MIFIDAGAFLARDIQRDQYHQQEAKDWCELLYKRIGCFASNLDLDEAITPLARRATHELAAPRAANLLAVKSLSILRPNETADLAALRLFHKYADQRVRLTACVSFVFMERQGVARAFSFDRRFALAGFTREP